MSKFVENLNLWSLGAVFFVTEGIVNRNGALVNRVLPVSELLLEEENTTTLQNSRQIYYITRII